MKRHRLWMPILALFLLLTTAVLVPKAQAQEAVPQEETATSTNLWVGSTEVTSEKLSGDGWSFDPRHFILTLTNYENIDQTSSYDDSGWSSSGNALINYKGTVPLTIKIVGSCTLGSRSYPGSEGKISGIVAPNCKLTITNEGTDTTSGLYIYTSLNGILAKELDIVGGAYGKLDLSMQSYYDTVYVFQRMSVTSTQGATINLYARGNCHTALRVRMGDLVVTGRPGLTVPNITIDATARGVFAAYRSNSGIYAAGSIDLTACQVTATVQHDNNTPTSMQDDILMAAMITSELRLGQDTQVRLYRPTNVDLPYRRCLFCAPRSDSSAKVVFKDEAWVTNDNYGETFVNTTFVSEKEDLIVWNSYKEGRQYASYLDFANFIGKNMASHQDEVSYIEGGDFIEQLPLASSKKGIIRLEEFRWKENLPLTFNDGVDRILDLTYGEGQSKTVTGINLQPYSGGTVRLNADCLVKDMYIKGPGTVYLAQGTSTGTLDASANLVFTGGSHNLSWTGETGTAKNANGDTVQKYTYQFPASVTVDSVSLRTSGLSYDATGLYPDSENKIYLWLTDPDQLRMITAKDTATGKTVYYYVKAGGPVDGVYQLTSGKSLEANPMDTVWFLPSNIQDITLSALTAEPSEAQLADYRLVWQTNEKDGVLTSEWYDCANPGGTTYSVPKSRIQDGLRYRCTISRQRVNSKSYEDLDTFEVVFKAFTPQITKQPENCIMEKPGSMYFEVQVEVPEGVQLRYYWDQMPANDIFWSEVPLITPIGGTSAHGPVLAYYADEGNDGYKYRCRITVSFLGTDLTTLVSDAGTLLFGTAPVIKTHPQDVSFDRDQPGDCTFTVEAEDPSKVTGYQWQRSTDGGETYQDLEDGKSASYVIHAPTADMDGYLYRCVVSNKIGSVTSDAAKLIGFRPPVLKPLQDLTYDVGDRPLIFASILDYGNPRATLYEFQISTDGGKTFRKVTDADGLVTPMQIVDTDGNPHLLTFSLDLWDLTAEMDGYMYRAGLGNVYGGETHMVWSEPMTLHVRQQYAPVLGPLEDLTAKVGELPSFSVNILDFGYPRAEKYEIQISTDGGETFRKVTSEDGMVIPVILGDASGNKELQSVTFYFPELTAEMDGYMYRAGLGNVYGGETHMTWTEPMTLHVIRNCEKDGHDWIDATCTAPKTCKACGATEGEALNHSYGAGWTADENTHWHACLRCGDHGDEAAHTPDREMPDVGVPVLCSVCGRTLREALEYSIHDVNRDGVVNLLDVTHAQRFYGLSEGDEGWNPNADVNGDGTVNIADLILILNNFFFQKA